MKILIIAPAWIGDAIMAQPLYRYLHQQYADVTLDVVAPAWSLPLLSRMPEVNQMIENPFLHGQLRLYQRWQLARQLKKNQYDQAIVLPNSFKSALTPWFAGIPRRTGYLGEQRRIVLNDIHRLDPIRLPRMVDRFNALALPTSTDPTHPHPARLFSNPQLAVDATEQKQTLARFGLTTDHPIAAFCPGAEYGPAKRWPSKHFAKLAQILHRQGYHIWLFGSSKEAAIADDIVQQSHLPTAVYNLCGKTQLTEAIDLMAAATVIVSNDSGLMHVAAALNRPLVALYGSSSPIFTPPLSELAEIVSLNLSCSPCFERVCPLTHFNCMEHLDAEQVDAAINKVVQRAQYGLS